MVIKLMVSNTCSAFEAEPVGSKVVDASAFLDGLETALRDYEFPDGTEGDLVAGQGFVPCPQLLPHVSSGEGLRTAIPDDYVARLHRGEVSLFLKREHAAPATFLACVVYTRRAYLHDPDVQGDRLEKVRISDSPCTHVLVAVIASAAPRAPLTPRRFAANLAGGNREAMVWSKDRIHEEARRVSEHWSEWCVVAG